MKFTKGELSGSYDEQYDILYIYYKGAAHSYATEEPDGFVTFRSINEGELTGYIVYDFIKKVETGSIDLSMFEADFQKAVSELTEEIQNGSIERG